MRLKINTLNNNVNDDNDKFISYQGNEFYRKNQDSAYSIRMIDDKTLKLAKKYIKDKEFVKKCEETKDSFDGDAPDEHRSLQKQVYNKTKYFNKKYYDANCAVIHYNDDETKLYKEKQAFKKKLKDELYKNYYEKNG